METEGNDEAELVDVVAWALSTSAASLPWAGSLGLWLCPVERLMPARSRRTPEIKQSPTGCPFSHISQCSEPFLFRGRFSAEIGGGLSGAVFQGDRHFTKLLFWGYFPFILCGALASLSSKFKVPCALCYSKPHFFGKERKAGLLCCNNSRPHSLRLPCVVFVSQAYFWLCDT